MFTQKLFYPKKNYSSYVLGISIYVIFGHAIYAYQFMFYQELYPILFAVLDSDRKCCRELSLALESVCGHLLRYDRLVWRSI